MKLKRDWSEYHKATNGRPPRPLLVQALEYVTNKSKALDIGGGALNDSRYLLEQGFDVIVIDKNPLLEDRAKVFNNEKLHPIITTFESYIFPDSEYDLVSAMYSLPFTEPEYFDSVFAKIISSLKRGGVFCGQFFGVNDEWSKSSKMTFHTKDQIDKLLKDMEVIEISEVEEEGPTVAGPLKHWHYFNVIARK